MGMSRLLEDGLFHLADHLGDADRAGQASVQLKMVRQRHTPSRSFKMSSRSSAFVSRDSKVKLCAFTMAAGPTKFSSAQKLGQLVVHAAQRMHFVVSS